MPSRDNGTPTFVCLFVFCWKDTNARRILLLSSVRGGGGAKQRLLVFLLGKVCF